MPDTTSSVTELRAQLLANGYTPLPNVGKACYLEGWPKVEVDEARLERWARRNSRFQDTGIRIENGLAVIDLDIEDDEGMRAVAEAIEAAFPQLLGALVRYGKGSKEAWFCRTAETFGRIHTFRFWSPGKNDPDVHTAHCVEIFGGGSPRQFGAFGAHTRNQAGEVVVAYEWAAGSPIDTPLADLPELTKADFFKIAEIAEATLRGLGFEQVLRSQSGESEAVRVYDLNDEMVFETNREEVGVTLAELRDRAGEEGLRVSASWLEPGRGHSLTRCLVGRSHSGELTIWDSASGVTHMPADASPEDAIERQLDVDAIAAKLRRLAEQEEERKTKRRAKLSGDDDHMIVAAKLVQSHAYCPNQQLSVVPIWATGTDEGMVLSAFRTAMLPWCGVEIGPRGGEKKINPVDLWSASKERVTVEGLRLRPDMPRPTFTEHGKLYINVSSPQVHPTGGTPDGGLALIAQLLPDAEERRYFTQWLAHKWLHPEVPGPAVLMVARDFGTGRGTLGELMRRLFGTRYVATIGFDHFAGRTYQSQYTEWQADSLVVLVNESSTADNGSTFRTKHDTYERLKEIVDPRAQERTIIAKGVRAYRSLVCASYIIATNNPDALPLPPDDRRFVVLKNGGKREPEFWEAINDWLEVPENIGAFAAYLDDVDLSDFDAFAPPPMTETKRNMSELSRSDLDRAFDQVIAELPGELLAPPQIEREITRLKNEDDMLVLPDRWQAALRRMIAKRLYRVGADRDATGGVIKVDGEKWTVYARTDKTAARWRAVIGTPAYRAEVLRNGGRTSIVHFGTKLGLAVDNTQN